MANEARQPDEKSSARDNHVTVLLDARTGSTQVLSDAGSEESAAAAVRNAIRDTQERSGVRLMTSAA